MYLNIKNSLKKIGGKLTFKINPGNLGSKLGVGFSLLIMTTVIFATNDTANQNLQRAMNELNAAIVYVQQAKEQTPPNQRIIFHYDWVVSDINKIRGGITQKFAMPSIQPRVIEPLKNDYLTVIGKQ